MYLQFTQDGGCMKINVLREITTEKKRCRINDSEPVLGSKKC
jgi:hypothetical protein